MNRGFNVAINSDSDIPNIYKKLRKFGFKKVRNKHSKHDNYIIVIGDMFYGSISKESFLPIVDINQIEAWLNEN